MKLKRVFSVLSAAVMAVTGVSAAVVNAEDLTITAEAEKPPIYTPDFPQEILEEFDIDWTGLSCNRFVENTEFDSDMSHNKFRYDGGYAMYGQQNYSKNFCYTGNWHECDSFQMYQSKAFPLSEYTEDMELKLHMYIHSDVKKEGELKTGPLLEINGGKEELFIVERYTSVTDFTKFEKIGSYDSDGWGYDLYRTSAENAEEGSPVRYYAVNTEGIVKTDVRIDDYNTGVHENFISNISDHLAKLREFVDTETVLDRYGMLTEGKGGVGYIYHQDELKGSYLTLTEEEIIRDENKDPVPYNCNVIKKFGGYIYSLQTLDSCMPINTLEDGRYEYSFHENTSTLTPFEDGAFTVDVPEGIMAGAFVGKEYDGKTPLGDNNCFYEYKYYVTGEENVNIGATVWTTEPYVRIDFQEESDIYMVPRDNYLGTIDLKGEEYDLYGQQVQDFDMAPLLEEIYNGYLFIHRNSGYDRDVNELREATVPVSALINAAKIYDLSAGNLCRIGLSANSYAGGFNLNVTCNNIIEDAPFDVGTSFVDTAKGYGVSMGPYTFDTSHTGFMYGYENGCFSAGSNGDKWAYFTSGIKKKYDDNYVIDQKHGIAADYKVRYSFDNNYEIAYELVGSLNKYQYKFEVFRIVEKSSDYPLEYNCTGSVTGMTRSPAKPDPQFVKTYTAGGHEYDLYKDYCVFWGCFSDTSYENYVSIRKDQDDSTTLEGSIDFNEHLRQIGEDFIGNLYLNEVCLAVYANKAKGAVEALRNDIKFDIEYTDPVIVGDINSDSRVDSMDVVAARKALVAQFDGENGTADEKVDINQNGSFEIADVVLLQSFVLGKIKVL